MNIALVTNLRAPYRTLQLKEFAAIPGTSFTVYYTDAPKSNRKWQVAEAEGFTEVDLPGLNIWKQYGYINKDLNKLVRSHDLIMLGGYEKPTYLLLSQLCRLHRKPYVLLYDGISANRVQESEQAFKKYLKNAVIKRASAIFGNGTTSRNYFHRVFQYPNEKIFNQYLSIDGASIQTLAERREDYRMNYRKRYDLAVDEQVLIYSGRLIDIKNVDTVLEALTLLKKPVTLVVIGGGPEEEALRNQAAGLGVKLVITGFLTEQQEVFKHYFLGDALILPSRVEPWGLVVNEAVAAGLPVIVSNRCGCAQDMVIDGTNGYTIDPENASSIAAAVSRTFSVLNKEQAAEASARLNEEWSFAGSRASLERMLESFRKQPGQKNHPAGGLYERNH